MGLTLTKKIKNFFTIILSLSIIIITTSGCAYVNNKNWNEMSPEEQEEVRQEFNNEKREFEASYSGNSLEDDFSRYILDKVEQAIENDH